MGALSACREPTYAVPAHPVNHLGRDHRDSAFAAYPILSRGGGNEVNRDGRIQFGNRFFAAKQPVVRFRAPPQVQEYYKSQSSLKEPSS
jgi:hypothetical protein